MGGFVLLLLAVTLLVLPGSAAAFRATTSNPTNGWEAALLVPPEGVTASFSCGLLGLGKGILVEWTAVNGVDGYEVWRSVNSGSYVFAASVDAAATSYADYDVNFSTTYDYVVRATASGWTSADSVVASVTTPSLCVV